MTYFPKVFMDRVFKSIAHGDDEHRAWLKKKCQDLESSLDHQLRLRDKRLIKEIMRDLR